MASVDITLNISLLCMAELGVVLSELHSAETGNGYHELQWHDNFTSSGKLEDTLPQKSLPIQHRTSPFMNCYSLYY